MKPPSNQIFKSLRGSHSRGTATPESDIDYFGVYIAPEDYYLGFNNKYDCAEVKNDEEDTVYYEYRKYIGLLLNSNPNVMESLWVDYAYILHETYPYIELRRYRDKFLSKKIYDTFTGYASGQLHRLSSVTSELVNELENLEEILKSADLDPSNLNPTQKLRDTIIYNGNTVDFYVNRYQILMKKFNGGGRLGAKRKNSIKELGYNTKNGAVLIMLLKMSIEALKYGELKVFRDDRDELLSIKQGKFRLEEIQAWANDLFAEAEQAYKSSSLPEEPDKQWAEKTCVKNIKEFLFKNYNYGKIY